MNLQSEIAKQVEKLPPSAQEQVLRFATSLTSELPRGDKGANLLAFSGSLDPESAREMTEAIEKECERIDPSEW